MKSKSLVFFLIIGSLFSCIKKDESLIFRNIGHTLLLHSGDTTSRVMPIKGLGDHTYLIEFESNFQLNPDSLINIVHRHLAHHSSKNEYRVNVFNCKEKGVVYGYEVTKTNDFEIPCTGRVYPKACYKIQIQLLQNNNYWIYLSSILSLALILVGYFKFKKKATMPIDNHEFLSIGLFKFYTKSKTLEFENEKVALSEKEAKLLLLFSEKPNEIIDRDTLLKEVWENDGVFVISRNLDVLVSKLRKKLQNDPSIKIINSHGKGYGLEV